LKSRQRAGECPIVPNDPGNIRLALAELGVTLDFLSAGGSFPKAGWIRLRFAIHERIGFLPPMSLLKHVVEDLAHQAWARKGGADEGGAGLMLDGYK
jgi:hypothetical protein